MRKLWIGDELVNTIMKYVRTTSFYVLVNGQSTGDFTLTRGLRQGDPLSPYLFLFCAEVLLALLQKNMDRGVLHGVRICRGASVVSNLFFADNTIIFGRKTPTELGCVKRILQSYEEASSQAINLNKSEIIFSGGISKERGKELAGMLYVIRVEQHAIYLGVPTNVGQSWIAIFRTLVARVEDKLKY